MAITGEAIIAGAADNTLEIFDRVDICPCYDGDEGRGAGIDIGEIDRQTIGAGVIGIVDHIDCRAINRCRAITIERVIARAAGDCIAAKPAQDRVGAAIAEEIISCTVTDEGVVTDAGDKAFEIHHAINIGARNDGNRLEGRCAVKIREVQRYAGGEIGVVGHIQAAAAAIHRVIAVAALDRIIARAAEERVGTVECLEVSTPEHDAFACAGRGIKIIIGDRRCAGVRVEHVDIGRAIAEGCGNAGKRYQVPIIGQRGNGIQRR